VGDLAEVLEGVRLRLDGIGVRVFHPADDADRLGAELVGLPLPFGADQLPFGDDGAARRQPLHFGLVVGERARSDHLDRIEAGAVAHMHEGEAGLGIPSRPDPALDGDTRAGLDPAGEQVGDAGALGHAANLPP